MDGMSRQMSNVVKVDPEFKHRVASLPGADKLMVCFQCGTCSSDCPVARRVDIFRPRTIIRLAVLGLKSALFDDGIIWLCMNCYTCQEHCPQGVRPTEVIEALRTLAVAEGRFHPSLKAKIEPLFKFGRMYEITEFENETRDMYGLPPVPPVNVEEMRFILVRTKVDRLLGVEIGFKEKSADVGHAPEPMEG